MKKVVVLSGAGISAESGIKTFRDSDGLWENYRIEDVATPEAWRRDQALVLDFYNQRRKQALTAEPNAAHHILAELEKNFEVQIITQNVDNLHERAGSTHVLHLHGELFKARSTKNPALIYELEDWALNVGDHCELGSQLRPHIVWFGEEVPAIQEAIPYCEEADVFIVVGTSLQVYPAAGLVDFVRPNTPIYVVDPNLPSVSRRKNVTYIPEKASLGLQMIQNQLQP
ncbi:NAD-dependent protein deacylase [Siphonobacter sp. BAB-5385]|uniref:SIR2 family NAD-dependent protein deacylase n=1 Tax=unclassified Siphonobacter TaxID=2635712 RepID=UPI000B9E0F67|nr:MULTISPECIES: NAD-dependent deacylase [unclassified Siphonobacter]OZI09296.1 NAD-dependent protein deacylase [Siphonobacter sp. BAB-5385]PMD98843.1 NAD-dependent protein deacylase [Siphonobacter sp. BAB-5405]